MPLEILHALVILGALVLYALSGGADYGGGVWDLVASGPRSRRQREAIEHAIAPIWEANHVWLILAVVILFAAFPRAFWAVAIALHVPLELFLVGVVLRGSASSTQEVLSYVHELEHLEHVESVQLRHSTSRAGPSGQRTDFELVIQQGAPA